MGPLIVLSVIVTALYLIWDKLAGGSDSVSDLGGVVDPSASDITVRIARGIAVAEGGYDSSGNNLMNGTRPSRNFNPGDMTQDLVGAGIGMDGPFIQYSSDQDGFACLYAQVNAWLNGTSRHANSGNSIYDISRFYTTTDQDSWAATVASVVGVDINTPIGEIG